MFNKCMLLLLVFFFLLPYEAFLDSSLANLVAPSFGLLSFYTYSLLHLNCNYLFTHLFPLLDCELLKAGILSYLLPNMVLGTQ